MRVKVITENSKQEWEQYVRDHAGSIAWQSFDWSTVLKKHYNLEFIPLAAISDAKICGILPLYRLGTAPGKNVLISVPYAVAGGMTTDHRAAEEKLLDHAISLSGQYQSRGIVLKQYKTNVQGPLRADDGYYNRELNIAREPDAIWQGLADANKQSIDDCRKTDLVLEYPSSDIGIFYKMLLRHHHAKGIPCVSRKWIEDLIAFKMYSAALLLRNGAPVAGSLVKEFKDTVSFPFTFIGRDDEKHKAFVYDLYWKLILHFSSRGKRIFHSGRIPATDEADAYRLGWGGTKFPYHYQYYPNTVTQTEFSRKRNRKRAMFEYGWKRIPERLAGLIGPHIVKRFP